jgi:hypothetical protein
MMHRCHDTKRKTYELYGGRGIVVCKHWHDFENFLDNMGICPGKGWSIDRIDNNKGYEPSNCRWVTQKEQMRNVRHNRNFTFNGKTMCVAAWAEELNMKPGILRDRLGKLRWSVEKAFTTKVKKQPRRAVKKECQ